VTQWEEELGELRVEFVRGSSERLARLNRALDLLRSAPADRAHIQDVRKEFHGFSGAGGTFGFPDVSELGNEGERACDALLDAARPAAPEDLGRCRALSAALSSAFAPAPPAKPDPPLRGSGAFTGIQDPEIVVAHGDASCLAEAGRQLASEGMRARTCGSIAAALRLCEERLPDGVLLGVDFPDGSAPQLVEAIRKLPGAESVPILVLAPAASLADKVETMHAGIDAWFEGPVDWNAVLRRLRGFLDRSQAETPRILSVEDDADQASFVRVVLESAGYEVRICPDPAHFESDMKAFRPDLVLMDVNLPGIVGYDLAGVLKIDDRYAALPVIFLTVESREDARIRARKAGADDFLVKPVSPPLLLSAVAARLERAQFLRSLIGHDSLTGLLSHGEFMERARAVAGQRHRARSRGAVFVLIDLDHFKSVNDRYGHPVGDRVLVALSALLRRRLRASDMIGRLGGEEFAVVLEGLTGDEAARLTRRLLDDFRAILHDSPGGPAFSVTFSAGIAVLAEGMTLDPWRKAADDALYLAKAAGRNRVEIATAPAA
jgi:diguanylate cyclase (GGDEF)-like protein